MNFTGQKGLAMYSDLVDSLAFDAHSGRGDLTTT